MDSREPLKREVFEEDAVTWLKARTSLSGCSFIASLPDISEFPGKSLEEWKTWFISTAALILSRVPDQGVGIFYQTDIKREGTWIDKSYLCLQAAEREGSALLWRKVVCRAPPGTPTFGKPGYSHLLCFSRGARVDLAHSSADVLPERGDQSWPRGMGAEAALLAARFVKEQVGSHTLVNPFCGEGAALAAAESYGLNAIGIERSPKRAERARIGKVVDRRLVY